MGLLSSLKEHMSEIIQTFKESDIKVLQRSFYNKRVNDSMYKTLKKLSI